MLLLMMLAQLFALDAYGQQRIVTGRVLDNATDENMIGVSVQVKGHTGISHIKQTLVWISMC